MDSLEEFQEDPTLLTSNKKKILKKELAKKRDKLMLDIYKPAHERQ
jgi:hypothetical protein